MQFEDEHHSTGTTIFNLNNGTKVENSKVFRENKLNDRSVDK